LAHNGLISAIVGVESGFLGLLALSSPSGHIEQVIFSAHFVASAADPKHFPAPSVPEIAFLGRSNVGKSSLINALVGSKIAKTSNTPGRTQTINFFELRRPAKPHPEFFFVDLPGYGYARVPTEISARWSLFIDPYLKSRSSLVLCLVLVDVSIPPQKLDKQLLEWLRHHKKSYLVVGTKSDRVSSNQLRNSLTTIAERLQIDTREIIPFSAKSRTGHAQLWSLIRTTVGITATAQKQD